MSKIPTGVIHKIVIGNDQLNGLVFRVGQEAIKGSGNVVHLIIEDEGNYHLFGNVRYFVFYKTPAGEERLWKSYVGVPVGIEYETNSTKAYK
jgi:hypothetical protein